MKPGEEKIDAKIGEQHCKQAHYRQPGYASATPVAGEPGVQNQGIEKPGDDRPGFLGIPAPVGAPGLVGPDSPADDASR